MANSLTLEQREELKAELREYRDAFGKINNKFLSKLMSKYDITNNKLKYIKKLIKTHEHEYDDLIIAYNYARKNQPIPENSLYCAAYRILNSLQTKKFRPRSKQIFLGESPEKMRVYINRLKKDGFVDYLETCNGRRYFLSETGKDACNLLSQYHSKRWQISEKNGSLELLLCKKCS